MAPKTAKTSSKTSKKAKASSTRSRTAPKAVKASKKATKTHKSVRKKVAKVKKTAKKVTKTAAVRKKASAPAKRKTKRTVKPAAKAKAARPKTAPARAGRKAPAEVESKPAAAEVKNTTTKVARSLNRRDTEQFRQTLLEKRAEILGDVSTLHDEALNKNRSEAAGDLSSMPIHMADLGTDNYELEFTLGLIEGERAILMEIDEALERVQNGSYGLCLATGKPIGKARLRAKPWAKYCYEYTLAQERGGGRGF